MYLFPTLVAAVCLVFAAITAQQFARRRRPYQLCWTVALLLSGLGTISYLLAVLSQSAVWFRLYYIMGGLLSAAYLGLGSLYLVASPRIGRAAVLVVTLLGLTGAVLIWRAPLAAAGLAGLAWGPGTGLLQRGLWLPFLIILNMFGTIAVVGVALLSVQRRLRSGVPRSFALGNGLIATGTLVVAGAGSLARLGWERTFWLAMALGWSVLFAGFLVVNTGRAVATTAAA